MPTVTEWPAEAATTPAPGLTELATSEDDQADDHDDDDRWTEEDEERQTLLLASARNPGMAFFPGDDDHGYERDYPDLSDY